MWGQCRPTRVHTSTRASQATEPSLDRIQRGIQAKYISHWVDKHGRRTIQGHLKLNNTTKAKVDTLHHDVHPIRGRGWSPPPAVCYNKCCDQCWARRGILFGALLYSHAAKRIFNEFGHWCIGFHHDIQQDLARFGARHHALD